MEPFREVIEAYEVEKKLIQGLLYVPVFEKDINYFFFLFFSKLLEDFLS